jgi:hypothetical protein
LTPTVRRFDESCHAEPLRQAQDRLDPASISLKGALRAPPWIAGQAHNDSVHKTGIESGVGPAMASRLAACFSSWFSGKRGCALDLCSHGGYLYITDQNVVLSGRTHREKKTKSHPFLHPFPEQLQ